MDRDQRRDLLDRAQAGDQEALWSVLQHHRAILLGRIRMMLGEEARRRASSIDFMQEVFVKAARKFDGTEFEDERAFLRWITAIARNGIRDSVRGRRERAFESLTSMVSVRAADATTPSEHVDGMESRLRLLEALEELPEDQREAIALRSLEELSHKEAAERMGRSSEAFRKLHHRAMIRLGQMMGDRRRGS